jgi:hypothetical protein
MQQAEVVATVRRAHDGDISKAQIRRLQTTTEQVAAAVGYILRHHSTFLDRQGRVIRPYPALLGELTGRSVEDHTKLRKSSGNHGLHRLAPPAPRGMALPGVRKPVILTPLEELERRVEAIPMFVDNTAVITAASDVASKAETSSMEDAVRIAEEALAKARTEGGEMAVDILYILLRGRRI